MNENISITLGDNYIRVTNEQLAKLGKYSWKEGANLPVKWEPIRSLEKRLQKAIKTLNRRYEAIQHLGIERKTDNE